MRKDKNEHPRLTCRFCDGPIPDGDPRKKYCSDEHRRAFNRAFAAQAKRNQRGSLQDKRAAGKLVDGGTGVPEYIKRARELAIEKLDTRKVLDDEVREVMREEIRSSIREVVRDNVVGAAEIMTSMLPIAMARLAEDLESESWPERSRAYSLLLRYGMPMMDAPTKDDDNKGTYTVVHHIPVPDTTLGRAFADELGDPEREQLVEARHVSEEYVQGAVEAFEVDWPVCSRCKQRKHPDNVPYRYSDGRPVCTACKQRDLLLEAAHDGRDDPEAENNTGVVTLRGGK